jgi:hypothetical protein
MANYCFNHAVISGDQELLKLLLEKILINQEKMITDSGSKSFTEFCNRVLGYEYGFSQNHFGTRWWNFQANMKSHEISISGNSAEFPPLEFFTKFTDVYGLHIEAHYFEPHCDFGGYFCVDNGSIIEHDEKPYLDYRFTYDYERAVIEASNMIRKGLEVDLEKYRDSLTDFHYNMLNDFKALMKLPSY